MCICAQVYKHACMHADVQIHEHVQTHMHTCICICAHMHKHAHTHPCMHTCPQTLTHASMHSHTCAHADKHTHPYTQTSRLAHTRARVPPRPPHGANKKSLHTRALGSPCTPHLGATQHHCPARSCHGNAWAALRRITLSSRPFPTRRGQLCASPAKAEACRIPHQWSTLHVPHSVISCQALACCHSAAWLGMHQRKLRVGREWLVLLPRNVIEILSDNTGKKK